MNSGTACASQSRKVRNDLHPCYFRDKTLTNSIVGSDVAGMTTTATKSDDGMYYIVDGSKKWVTQGAWATHALVAVRTGKAGAKGISMFIIPLDDKDIERKRMINSGVNASGKSESFLVLVSN